ncbi:MAG: ABC transporter permease [Planctomycetaceae bacterium]|nr:ABC transporter permease [Planctomycetaceae bacterium]
MNAWQIAKKDLRLLARDRRTLFILVALPLTFITILGFSTGQLFNEREKARRVRLGVVNEDQSNLSEKLLEQVKQLNALEVLELPERRGAKQSLAEGKLDVLVFIGPKYSERVEELDLGDIFYSTEGRLAGKLPALDIQVESGAFLANAAQVVQELVFAFALQSIAPDVLRAREPIQATRLLSKARQAREQREPGIESGPIPAVPPPQSRSSIVYQTLVPAYTVMFVFFLVNFMARSFIGEREMGTLDRLRIAPITRTGLLFGKTFPFFVISLVQSVLLFLAGKLIFGMSWGAEPLRLVPVIVCTSLAATTLGLLVATVVRTESQVSAYGNFLVLILASISGCLMPRSWQPELMQQIGLITPHAWALIAYDQLLNRELPDLEVVTHCCLMLLAFAAGFFALGWWRFRRME